MESTVFFFFFQLSKQNYEIVDTEFDKKIRNKMNKIMFG